MVFRHIKTGKPALMTTDKSFSDDYIPVTSWENLRDISDNHPKMWWSNTFNIPPEIENQGQKGLLCYFRAFFNKCPKTIYFFFMPSGFPDGKMV